jgi:2-keto-4-pentenoate hydratase
MLSSIEVIGTARCRATEFDITRQIADNLDCTDEGCVMGGSKKRSMMVASLV